MFETSSELWQEYSAALAAMNPVPSDDLLNLAAEVRIRLGQLDLILEDVDRSVSEFGSQLSARASVSAAMIERNDYRLRLHTESFYLFAERLVEVLNSKIYSFPFLGRVKAAEMIAVRHQLIMHPEKTSRNFSQSITITSDGPTLRTAAMVVRGSTGTTHADPDSLDKGLNVNARTLKDEFEEKFERAVRDLMSAGE